MSELKQNLLSRSQWMRILYMAFFAVVCWLLGIIMIVLVIGQTLFVLVSGKDNENLRQLGSSLSLYFFQILLFLTYKSEARPFPFSAFPGTDEDPEPAFEEAAPMAGDTGAAADSPVAGREASGRAAGVAYPPGEAASAPARRPPEAGPEQSAATEADDVFADISFTEARDGGSRPAPEGGETRQDPVGKEEEPAPDHPNEGPPERKEQEW